MKYTTWIEINQTALEHNINQYRSWLPTSTRIAAVVKANAYGHGAVAIGKILDQNPHIVRLCVASSAEAVQLRQHEIKKPILILGFINTPITDIVQYDLDMMISDLSMLHDLNVIGQNFNKKINVHLKIDTGLSRLGIMPHDVAQAFEMIDKLAYLNLQAISSHFIEAFNKDLVHKQEEILARFRRPGLQTHIANSNSSLHTKYEYDFVRIGAGLYGYLPEAEPSKQQLLKPILSFKTRIISIKQVPQGVSVGYGSTTYITTKPTTVATLGLGYYEGIDPDLANSGHVIIHDEFAPMIGRINMNYLTVDVTHIPQAKLYDEAIILGNSTTKTITGYDWRIGAKKNVRLFLARLNGNIPKEIVQEPIILSDTMHQHYHPVQQHRSFQN